MLYKMIKDTLSRDNVESLTLNLSNQQSIEVIDYNKYKSDDYYLFVVEPQINIVSLKHVINIDVNLKDSFDVSQLKF